jgi:hypothetical protein
VARTRQCAVAQRDMATACTRSGSWNSHAGCSALVSQTCARPARSTPVRRREPATLLGLRVVLRRDDVPLYASRQSGTAVARAWARREPGRRARGAARQAGRTRSGRRRAVDHRARSVDSLCAVCVSSCRLCFAGWRRGGTLTVLSKEPLTKRPVSIAYQATLDTVNAWPRRPRSSLNTAPCCATPPASAPAGTCGAARRWPLAARPAGRRALEGGRGRARPGRARAALGPTPCCAASQAPTAPASPCTCLCGD